MFVECEREECLYPRERERRVLVPETETGQVKVKVAFICLFHEMLCELVHPAMSGLREMDASPMDTERGRGREERNVPRYMPTNEFMNEQMKRVRCVCIMGARERESKSDEPLDQSANLLSLRRPW